MGSWRHKRRSSGRWRRPSSEVSGFAMQVEERPFALVASEPVPDNQQLKERHEQASSNHLCLASQASGTAQSLK